MATHAIVNNNRRTTYRRMAQMNEDRLTSLRNPPRAEATRRVQGHLESHNAVLKKQVNLWYKEQNFALNKLNRGQNKVYKTFLRVNYEQKKLDRLANEKKRQQALMEKFAAINMEPTEAKKENEISMAKKSVVPPIVSPREIKVTNVEKEGTTDSINDQSTTDTVKKYNRHRSEFNVVANAPVSINVAVGKAPNNLEPLKESAGEKLSETSVQEKKKPEMKAKVLVVRKQNEGMNNSLGEMFDVGFNRDRSTSFLTERSGSFYIQTVVMANEQKEKDSPAENIKVQAIPQQSNAKPVLQDKKSKANTLPSKAETSSRKTTLTLDIKQNKNAKKRTESGDDSGKFLFRSRKVGVVGPGYALGELRNVGRKYSKAPPTSYSYSTLEDEKQRQRVAHTEYLSRQEEGDSNSGYMTNRDGAYSSRTRLSPSESEKMTLVEYNKFMKKQRGRIRKEALDAEVPMLYEKNEKGELIISKDDFKRRQFKKPSSAEWKNRVKLLHQSRQDMKDGTARVMEYIDKLSEQERMERMEREKKLRQKMDDEAAARAEAEKHQVVDTDPSVLLHSLIKAFRKGDYTDQYQDANSLPGLRQCDYLRVYEMRGERTRLAMKKKKKKEKISSWNQAKPQAILPS